MLTQKNIYHAMFTLFCKAFWYCDRPLYMVKELFYLHNDGRKLNAI